MLASDASLPVSLHSLAGLVLFCKEEKKAEDVDESSYRDVPLRLRVPPPSSQKPIEASVPNLHAPCFKLNEAFIWPVRSLLPPHEVAGELGACASPSLLQIYTHAHMSS
jgi:hypothetical protein